MARETEIRAARYELNGVGAPESVLKYLGGASKDEVVELHQHRAVSERIDTVWAKEAQLSSLAVAQDQIPWLQDVSDVVRIAVTMNGQTVGEPVQCSPFSKNAQ